MGHPIGADTVRKELVKLGFSCQYNRKAKEGSKHPDRDTQFEHINAKVVATEARSQPIISVDTKKRAGRQLSRTAAPTIGRRASVPSSHC